ncbi:FKBP-type peptidyl-prolyl cis-trans isomerase [Pedobacter gandavensis]|uniref:FKBP-type peptidyl-prolyl cis-trans isomerase n=1 Tax=Pedobacter gandavensis TaxID=2679963 RepID=UPI00292E4E3F|nr:FKBP-type peptidyl-prolyl cis-trans isomerase [Pedobacter gandavensis]
MLKNKILLLLFLGCAFFAACEQTPPYDGVKQLELDALTIKKYKDSIGAAADSIIVDPSGLNYQIITKGQGTVFPKDTDQVVVYYEGRILRSASTFESVPETDSVVVDLNKAMPGWKIGLGKITKGGRIRMIIPSALGYENFTGSGIPPFSILDYTVTLKNIK